jgi:hypothetical protein
MVGKLFTFLKGEKSPSWIENGILFIFCSLLVLFSDWNVDSSEAQRYLTDSFHGPLVGLRRAGLFK